MKLSLLDIRTRSQVRSNRSPRSTVPYKEAIQVGVLFTVEDRKKHDNIKEFVHRLEKDGKKVSVFSFLPKRKDNHEFLYDFFTIQDISFWGNIISTGASKFNASSFDYLFYADLEPNPILLNLVARSKAKCRIGRYSEHIRPYFEFMIDSGRDIKSLLDGMYNYSHQFK